MHYAIGVSAPSLHRESTDSYIHVNAVRGDHNRIKHVCSGGSRISERVVPKNVGMLCAPKFLRGHAHLRGARILNQTKIVITDQV